MIQVAWPDWEARNSWDQNIVLELTAGDEYQHGASVPLGEGAVLVIPGQHHVLHAAQWASEIERLPWALTIVTSDEEALFPVELLPRDATHAVWTQYHDRGMDKVIPIGAAPPFLAAQAVGIDPSDNARKLAISFAGQDTHERRHELIAAMKDMAADGGYGNIVWLATTGFRQGLGASEYAFAMRNTRIAPCPSGPHSLDSFRLYEALAAGCLPIVEMYTPQGFDGNLWSEMFDPGCPIPWVSTWADLPFYAERYRSGVDWRAKRDEVQAWWHDWRAGLSRDFTATIERLRES